MVATRGKKSSLFLGHLELGNPARTRGQTSEAGRLGKAPSGAPCLWYRSPHDPGQAYSPSKVIHRWRGEPGLARPQPPVNNFGGGAKMVCGQRSIWLNQKVEHAGSGRRIPSSNVTTFLRRRSLRDPAPCRKGTLRTFRLQVQTWQRRTPISASIRQGPRAQHNQKQQAKYDE